MFQNRTHDPLAIPTRTARRSVGPTFRHAESLGQTSDPSGSGVTPSDMGAASTGGESAMSSAPAVGSAAPDMSLATMGIQAALRPFWFTAADADMTGGIADGGGSGVGMSAPSMADGIATSQTGAGGVATPPGGSAVPSAGSTGGGATGEAQSRTSRVLAREARNFIAAQNTDDTDELLYRAARHAATHTSTWSPSASKKTTRAFVAQVAELIPRRPRVASAPTATTFADFDDQLLY